MSEMNYARVSGGRIGQLVRAPKTSELIATQLRRQIVRGTVKPGEKLPPETRLMEQFGVSRPTIREAFRILETEGLIVVRPGSRGGAQVVAPDQTAPDRAGHRRPGRRGGRDRVRGRGQGRPARPGPVDAPQLPLPRADHAALGK